MSGFLLDTNVVSEPSKERPDRRVIAFLRWVGEAWLSTAVIHELEFGVQSLPSGRRQIRMRADLAALVSSYSDRILPIDRKAAEAAARCRVAAIRSGRTPSVGDMLIAGTAATHNLTLATRNVRDFEGLGIQIVNPWDFDLGD